jgi:hypothetical protein
VTLVLTALTPSHIVQVSDRRVVRRWPSGRIDKLDGRIKAIITPVFACSYTGSAILGGVDTGEWIATILSDHVTDHDGGLEALRVAAGAELANRQLNDHPLAIACVGWTPGDKDPEPLLVALANFDVRDYTASRTSQDLTVFNVRRKKGRRTLVFPLGQPLLTTEMVSVNRSLRRLVVSARATSRSLAQVLRETVQVVARSPDRKDFVSEDVLVTALPRPDLLRVELVAGKLENNIRSVTRIAPGPSRREEQGGPLMVGNGAVWAALTPEEGPPGGGVAVAGRWVRVPAKKDAESAMYILTDPPVGPAWGFPGGDT